MGAVAVAELQLFLNLSQAVLEALVEEANNFPVVVDLLVGVGIGLHHVQVSVGQLLKSWLHSSRDCGIGNLEVALALMGSLDTRIVVDLCAATATNSWLASGASRCAASSAATSSAASATASSPGRAWLMKRSITHGVVAIQK